MTKKIFLPTNDEIAMMKLEKSRNKVTRSSGWNDKRMHGMFSMSTNKSQIRPRMLLEGMEAMKVWKKERELQDDN